MKVILFALGALATMFVIVSVDMVEPQASMAHQSAHTRAEAADEGHRRQGTPWYRRWLPAHSPIAGKSQSAHGATETDTQAAVDSAASPRRADDDSASAAESEQDRARSHAAANSGAIILRGEGPGAARTSETTIHGSGVTQTGSPNTGSSNQQASNSQHTSISKSRSSAATPSNADRPTDACSRCESMPHDDNHSCPDSYNNCRSLPGVIGPENPKLAGTSKAQLCTQILDCIHQTKCAGPNASGGPATTDCLCGRDIDPDTCFRNMTVSQTRGSCRDLMVAGTESEDLEQIAMRFFDPTSATGAAVAVVETCDIFACTKECL